MTDMLNEYYSRQNRRKTHAGMSTKANKAEHCGGVPPLGYNVGADGKLTVNEAEAETVKEIFRLFLLGYSLNSMAELLNDKGLRTKAGRPFTKNSFSNILTQEKYIGVYRWNRRKAKNSKGQHNNHAYKPLEEQTVIEGGCPAIIPLEQYQAVQEKLSERKQGKADTKSRRHYMLGSLKILKCSVCGSYMVGKVNPSHGKNYTAYACPKHKGGQCPTKDIRAEELEEYIADTTINCLVTKSNVSQLNHLAQGGNDKKELMQNELTSLNKRIDNLTKSLEAEFSPTVSKRLRELEQSRDNLTSQMEEANADVPCITDGNLEQFKGDLSDYIRAANDPNVKEALKTYIEEIQVSNEDVKVTLQL